ncbi:MAG: enoyl-CoA hydratase/isomerase family protein [Deltaproteobacteria bacterium]|nr:enoyl-CoA hydratase/isomerase family protein [Deltaproteobacteria bacterium]
MTASPAATVRVSLEEDGRLLCLTLDKPKGNILSLAMMRELLAALEAHRGNEALRLVLIGGAGGHFSFGAAIDEHRPETVRAMLATFHSLCRGLAAYPVPTAALVEGQCLGGAFELVLCCHFVLAAKSAVFGCPELKLGVFPPVLAAVGAERLGGPLAERLLLTGDTMSAETAHRAGWLTELFVEGDAVSAARRWAQAGVLSKSAFALRQAVTALRQGSALQELLGDRLSALERQYLAQVVPSHDGNEGLQAFSERRAPQWKDR